MFVLVIVAFFNISISFASHPCGGHTGFYSNADYNGERTVAMVEVYYNCYVHLYEYTTSTEYIKIGQLNYRSWEEVEEGVWVIIAATEYYVSNKNEHEDTYYILFKFSINDTTGAGTLEATWSKEDYPDEVSPMDATYSIHYRQE
jgi:hypothetical protein